ncbi:hypothetical protein AOLI_G00204250 [Acnodon oligacanthus]
MVPGSLCCRDGGGECSDCPNSASQRVADGWKHLQGHAHAKRHRRGHVARRNKRSPEIADRYSAISWAINRAPETTHLDESDHLPHVPSCQCQREQRTGRRARPKPYCLQTTQSAFCGSTNCKPSLVFILLLVEQERETPVGGGPSTGVINTDGQGH